MPVRYVEHAPHPALAAHVACYWTVEASAGSAQRVLPDGCSDLVFEVGEGTLVGTMTHALAIVHAGRAQVFGVRFRPGEAFALVQVPAVDVRDRVVSLADVWGRWGAELGERVAAARDDAARVALLDRELVDARPRAADARVRRAVARIFASPHDARIARLARELGLGERQLERAFDERVGVGPKALARVARLQAVARVAAGADPIDWARTAAEHGFADQAHLAREVRSLACVTPSELAREAARNATWPVAV
jgi:AraC-like DNA-binding protein